MSGCIISSIHDIYHHFLAREVYYSLADTVYERRKDSPRIQLLSEIGENTAKKKSKIVNCEVMIRVQRNLARQTQSVPGDGSTFELNFPI
jgi:hypothetical protein